MQLLQRVKGLVNAYKSEKNKYQTKPDSERDYQVTKQYESGDNLLSFLPV